MPTLLSVFFWKWTCCSCCRLHQETEGNMDQLIYVRHVDKLASEPPKIKNLAWRYLFEGFPKGSDLNCDTTCVNCELEFICCSCWDACFLFRALLPYWPCQERFMADTGPCKSQGERWVEIRYFKWRGPGRARFQATAKSDMINRSINLESARRSQT